MDLEDPADFQKYLRVGASISAAGHARIGLVRSSFLALEMRPLTKTICL